MNNKFFTEISNTKPYFKAAFEGFPSTGKTYTSALVAIGLHQKIKSKKPIIFFDTEKAAKFLKGIFAKAKIQILVKESKSMADLAQTMKFCREGGSDVLMIDSISHVWENFLEAYRRKRNRTFLQFQDWGIIKPTWKQQYSDPFVNDPYNIIMCGRAGYEYENEVNQDTGKREIYKSGIKMKVEGETAYEPDLLVLMERFEELLGREKRIYRTATVVKDRSTIIDGKVFVNPTFANFEPAIDAMLANPSGGAVTAEQDAGQLFKTEEDKQQYIREKKIILEEIEGQLLKAWPSTGAQDKKAKLDTVEMVFDTRSWLQVTQLGLADLQNGLKAIREIVDDKLAQQFPDRAGQVMEAKKAKQSKAKVKAKAKK